MKPTVAGWRTVLIVDDDRDTREMYTESLRADGFEPLAATSAEDALRLMGHASPAVVVTDLRLPGKMDGVDLIRHLRQDGVTREVGIIMLTGAAFEDARARAEDAGCDVFLLKPCLPASLASQIRRLAVDRALPRDRPPVVRAHARPKATRDDRRKA